MGATQLADAWWQEPRLWWASRKAAKQRWACLTSDQVKELEREFVWYLADGVQPLTRGADINGPARASAEPWPVAWPAHGRHIAGQATSRAGCSAAPE
jgi:hypothetical protein